MVFLSLVAFFAVVAGINAVMIGAAISTFGGVETASAYQAGLAFAREVSVARAQDALHWQVRARIRAIGQGAMQVEVTARDADNRPIAGLSAHGRLAHPANKRADRTLTLFPSGSGRFIATSAAVHGQWDLIIELEQHGVRRFRSRNRVNLP